MIEDQEGTSCASILDGVNDQIDSALCLRRAGSDPRYGTRSGLVEVMPLIEENALSLIESIRDRIQGNWNHADQHSRSEQNWRFTKNKGSDPGNGSKEVQYERRLVSIPEDVWPDSKNWANQVPVASGLAGANCDRRRCIDVVHKRGDCEYDFIELKIDSNTPLYAAMEILVYGILYVFYRESDCLLEYRYNHEQENMLLADSIHLMVAAPSRYYSDAYRDVRNTKVDLSWLEPSLNRALAQFLAKSEFQFKMDFKFMKLGDAPFPQSPMI
jgi:hypothetical protein